MDASTTAIGWSIFEDDDLVSYGKLTPDEFCDGWRERIVNFIPKLNSIVKEYKPQEAYIEDVPLIASKSKLTLVQLGAVQGMLLGVLYSNTINVNFIRVGAWRKKIGLFDGTKEGKERDILKQHSIEKANELFGLDLNCVFTKSGKYNGSKSDDDISDSILIFASTREKYCMGV